ncbi:hypothetical protein TWF696_006947 [Orbilia brochopaga]|uniref:Uncharacterized protein n=1 Tax=Orbilia brochopaga TaxID=3140254 RepID=A0AAV9UTR3_9PEZI
MSWPRAIIFTSLLGASSFPRVSALDWDDFTNNFATDLAPLITLFGEQVTKQFLSESLTIWDNIIFAMAPLGLLTAVVSVIRVAGTPSMRAFIGRAQESPGTAEVELLSCTSETTSELFNEGGIARVFGEPRILEVMVRPDKDTGSIKIGLFTKIGKSHWRSVNPTGTNTVDDEKLLSPYHRPNLSLNVGITKVPPIVHYIAALIGVVLQTGVVIFAGLTVYKYPQKFITTSEKPAEAYAFPLMLCGTIMVCFGVFLCAFIIERSTNEIHYEQWDSATVKSTMFWIQPGGQSIGDQVFGSFIGYSDDSRYIRSTKARPKAGALPILWTAVISTLVGFIAQFVGLRAMHASIILAMVVATMVMAVIRSMLRTQRMDKTRNLLSNLTASGSAPEDEHLFSRDPKLLHGHELDFFSMHLFNVESLFAYGDKTGSLIDSLEPKNKDFYAGDSLEARRELATILRGDNNLSAWKDLQTRVLTDQLASAIEGVMEVICMVEERMSGSHDQAYEWPINLDLCYQNQESDTAGLIARPTTPSSELRLHIWKSDRGNVSWKVDRAQLEALLSLWTLSIKCQDAAYIQQTGSGFEIRNGHVITTDPTNWNDVKVWASVWIGQMVKLSEVEGAKVDGILRGRGCYWKEGTRLFGEFEPSPKGNVALNAYVYHPDYDTLQMCAQDIFKFFLYSAFNTDILNNVGGKTEVRTSFIPRGDSLELENSTIEAMVNRFENAGLGSREDAYVCIIPILYRLNKLPPLDDVMDACIDRAEMYRTENRWVQAQGMLKWLTGNLDTATNPRPLEKLTEIYHSAMLEKNPDTVKLGFDGICQLINDTATAPAEIQKRVQEYAWIGMRVAEDRNFESAKTQLRACGVKEDLVDQYTPGQSLIEWVKRGEIVVLKYLAGKGDTDWDVQDSEGLTALCWAIKNQNTDIVDLILRQNVDTNIMDNDDRSAISFASEFGLHGVIDALLRQPTMDLNIPAQSSGKTALMYAAENGHKECVKLILYQTFLHLNNQDLEGNSALKLAAKRGHCEIVKLLLEKGADADKPDMHDATALHDAAAAGYDDTVRLLLERGANINHHNSDVQTPLDVAVLAEHTTTVTVLLEKGAKVLEGNRGDDYLQRSSIHLAARVGNLGLIKLLTQSQNIQNDATALIEDPLPAQAATDKVAWFQKWAFDQIYKIDGTMQQHIDPLAQGPAPPPTSDDRKGYRTVAFEAVHGMHEDVLIYLINSGADTGRGKVKCNYPIHEAVELGCISMVELLFKNGRGTAFLKGPTDNIPLHTAALTGNTDIVRYLLDPDHIMRQTPFFPQNFQKYIDALNWHQLSALHIAAENGHTDVAELLLERGATIHLVNRYGLTPMDCAIRRSQFDMIRLLQKKGANINHGEPLTHLGDDMKVPLLEFLIGEGVDVNKVDQYGSTALIRAATYGYDDVVQLLLENGAAKTINHLQPFDGTALVSAVSNNNITITRMLLDAGADPNIPNRYGFTPFFYLSSSEIARLLLEHGGDITLRDKEGETAADRCRRLQLRDKLAALEEGLEAFRRSRGRDSQDQDS